jgi:hypothetical protein
MEIELEIDAPCNQCGRVRLLGVDGSCRPCATDRPTVSYQADPPAIIVNGSSQASVDAVSESLRDIVAASRHNSSVQGIGSLAGGQLQGIGFSNKEGYITAIRNGVPGRTHAEYMTVLRSRYGMTTADIAALALPGPMTPTALPDGPGIKHVPTGPSVFDRPRSERTFVVGPKANDVVEAAPIVKLEHGQLIAGATAEGHGVLVGWQGQGKLSRGALVAAIETLGVRVPLATSARAQAGRVMGELNGLGYVVRVAREARAVNTTIWTIGRVNHKSLVGSELGEVTMRATLHPDGSITTDGGGGLAEQVQAKYKTLVEGEIYQAADITGWLVRTLMIGYDAVRFGVGWYVPARHAAAAGELCATVSKIWGSDWIVPALPVATSDQLRDGIVRGLTDEVASLLHKLATERNTAQVAYEDRVATHKANQQDLMIGRGDIGPKRAASFLVELRAIGARMVAYGQILGEERVKLASDSVRAAVVELESVLSDDFSGISARFAAVWDEIELDRKRSGGVL